MNRQIINTADGSSSIYLKDMDEHYHSKHGAIAESQHIFIDNGLLTKSQQENVRVFEVGMGTGLNVLTSLLASKENQLKVEMFTIEAFPIKQEEVGFLNFSEQLECEEGLFEMIHNSEWHSRILLHEDFTLVKIEDKLQLFDFEKEFAEEALMDLIYFDAFAPEKQEEMWSESIFERLFSMLKVGGTLVTYCVKGEIRRRLQKVGFTVEKLPGPIGGKREMCRARKL